MTSDALLRGTHAVATGRWVWIACPRCGKNVCRGTPPARTTDSIECSQVAVFCRTCRQEVFVVVR